MWWAVHILSWGWLKANTDTVLSTLLFFINWLDILVLPKIQCHCKVMLYRLTSFLRKLLVLNWVTVHWFTAFWFKVGMPLCWKWRLLPSGLHGYQSWQFRGTSMYTQKYSYSREEKFESDSDFQNNPRSVLVFSFCVWKGESWQINCLHCSLPTSSGSVTVDGAGGKEGEAVGSTVLE